MKSEKQHIISLNDNKIQLRRSGEIRFGPPIFDLTIFDKKLEDLSFLEWYVYSERWNKLIITEYINTTENEFYTQLSIFNLENGKKGIYGRLKNGIIRPKHIEGEELIFTREWGDGLTKEYEIPLNKI